MAVRDYGRLKELLEQQETFPLRFLFKFIGDNSPNFRTGVGQLEADYPGLTRESARESSAGNHLAMTYSFVAANSSEIIVILEAISQIRDVKVIL